ncbi:cell division protein FtsW [Hyphomicrobium denitrificans 1NES1]|uniref:Probable peptidoglycan glycosyltransferase FtsW n=1 Tax=Hyphomicrobium denitrificans 1NES1 TaxID=670307 RepID=N0AZ82_9HYPH|nr:putative peptidoglycan glycosyltransferase FtsW [Hyphomicrobium denitrificans]AGK56434.1 cell division protein FtsW [Hyphomicrobium denitrificans 1NES1]
MKLSRADRSMLADWSFTIDRGLLTALLALVAIGVVLSFAASPAVAIKKGLPTYYFVERHVAFAAIGAVLMLVISLFSPASVRRLAAVLLLASVVGMIVVLFKGTELNGAQRWLTFGSYSLQPSEFAKPAFIVVIAWLYGEAAGRSDMPALPLALLLWGVVAGLLVAQPDVGQTVLISTTAGLLYLLAGLPPIGAAILALIGSGGFWLAYMNFGHVQSRLEKFFSAAPFENYQVGRAMQSFSEGGFFGRGPGEGTIKSVLPDAHTDYIFAVIGEEYGVIACVALLAVFAYIVIRAMQRASDEPTAADRLAVQGLALLLGLQALINMGVNIGLLPPKGMTLPFISAGGSSMLALAITAGMLLALTRWRPDPTRLKKPRRVATIDDVHFTSHTPSV